MHEEHPVIYLTGAPAAGKSTTVKALLARFPSMHRWDWGEQARRHVSMRLQREVSYDEIRAQSETLITPDDVVAVDRILLDWAAQSRRDAPVLIDTHAVTRESFGFRTTPFIDDDWKRLRASHIVLLYASPEVIAKRLEADPAGRLTSDPFHVGLHAALQGAVATTYAIMRGLPLYSICTDTLDADGVATMIASIAQLQ